jgi:uncharacterized protein
MTDEQVFCAVPSQARTYVDPGPGWWAFWIFTACAFGITWTFWGLAVGQAREWLTIPVPSFGLMILGGLGPLAAANVAAAICGGNGAVRGLWRQIGHWRVGWIWYALLIVIFLMRLLPLVVPLAAGQSLDWRAAAQTLVILPILFLFILILGGGLDEEMGWRGFALGRLQSVMPPVPANLVLGLVWSFWHVPLWFVPGSAQASVSFPVYLLSTVALSFGLGWVYNRTGQSLLLATLAHSISNAGDNLRYAFLGFPNPQFDTWSVDIALAIVFVILAAALVIVTNGTLGAAARSTQRKAV